MEIEVNFWEILPDDLLCSILARLPIRILGRMRTVCKQWNSILPPGDELQRTDPNFSVNSIPGFFIQLSWGPQDLETWVIELGNSDSDTSIYKSPFPRDQIVVDACKSICCCHRDGDRLDLSIGNPATRTWRRLPRPFHVHQSWNFNAMTFDATSRRCTVMLGENSVDAYRRRSGNSMVLEIYDSESNSWTRVSMTAPRFIQPHGTGLYSKGKVYWVITWNGMYFMVAFDIADSSWAEIRLPEGCASLYPAALYLSGCDGRVVLIHKEGDIRIWRLIEGQCGAGWSEPLDMCMPERHHFYQVVANLGWVMLINQKDEIYLCNPERNLTNKISLAGRLSRSEGSRCGRILLPFQSNNVWWP